MSNVVALHGGKRWKAEIECRIEADATRIEHFFEEISDLHLIIEHGPDLNLLIRCTLTLNRPENGEEQNGVAMGRGEERSG